jgi:hypothetical protein
MKTDLRSLRRLTVVAEVLRDRHLNTVALTADRLAEIDRQLDALDSLRASARDAARSIATSDEYLRYQAYADLTDSRRFALTQEREEHKAATEAAMAEARHAFARADVLKTLETEAELDARLSWLRNALG